MTKTTECIYLCVCTASTADRDRKWSTHNLGKTKRDRIKVLKMGPWDSRPLGSRALFLGATSLLFSVLASRKDRCASMKSASCVPGHLSHFIDYFKLSVVFLYKGYRLAGGHRPAYALGKHRGVCTSSALNLDRPGVPRSTLCFSLA